MALKLKISKLEDADEKDRHNYQEKDDGWHLSVEGLPDVSGYETALEKERRRNRDLVTKMQAYEIDGGMPDAEQLHRDLAELGDLRQRVADEGKGSDEKTLAAVDRVRKEFEGQFEVLKQARETEAQEKAAAQQKLRTHQIQTALESAALTRQVRKEYLDDVKLRASLFSVVEDEDVAEGQNVVMIGADGSPIISTKAGQKYVTADDWLEKQAQIKPGWFEPSSGGGAAGGRGNLPIGGRVPNPQDNPAAFLANLDAVADGKQRVG